MKCKSGAKIEDVLLTGPNKVLAITKRTAKLCATQSLLAAAGFDLVTATNMPTALALLRSVPICGLIICLHSWTEAERENLVSELRNYQLPMMRCPGCTGADETSGKAGTLDDFVPLTNLIGELGRPA